MKIGKENIEKHEVMLNKIITDNLAEIVELIGPKDPEKRGGIFSFNLRGVNPHEIAMMLDEMENVCVRSGAHCVHSWFNSHNLEGSIRASLYLYNTREECEKFAETVKRIADLVK